MKKVKQIVGLCVILCLLYAVKEQLSTKSDNHIQKETNKKQDTTTAKQQEHVSSTRKLTIVLDPGHGGKDSGAEYVYKGKTYYEKTLNLKVAIALKKELESYQGVTVKMTRTEDTSVQLEKRVSTGKEMDADVFISLHHNAKGEIVDVTNGVYVLVASGNDDGDLAEKEAKLGANILYRLHQLGLENQGLLCRLSETKTTYSNGKLSDYYAIVKNGIECDIPAIIIEHGFMDRKDEFATYFSTNGKLEKLAKQDAKGIADYYDLVRKDTKVSRKSMEQSVTVTTIRDAKGTQNLYKKMTFHLKINEDD